MLEWITQINNAVNGVVWGPAGLALLFGTGLIMSVRTGFFQFRKMGYWLRHTIGAIFTNKDVTAHTSKEDMAISQFQSMCTALAGTIGTGNIVGVATAIVSGGPGAIFWMWVMALLGMMTSFSENVLGVYYRRKNEKGEWSGGAMYYLTDGLGAKKGCKQLGKVLAVLFACFCILASFGIGNMSQLNSIAGNMNAAFGVPTIVTGLALMVVTALIVIGEVVLTPGASITYNMDANVMLQAIFENLIDWGASTLPEKSTLSVADFTIEYYAENEVEVDGMTTGGGAHLYMPLEGGKGGAFEGDLVKSLTYPQMGAGEQQIRVTFKGDEAYRPSTPVEGNLTVNKAKVSVKVHSTSIYAEEAKEKLGEGFVTTDPADKFDIYTIYGGMTSDVTGSVFVQLPERITNNKLLKLIDDTLSAAGKPTLSDIMQKGTTVGKLKEYLNDLLNSDALTALGGLLSKVGIDLDTLRQISDTLNKFPGLLDNVRVAFGTPDQAGIYTVYAITNNKNYETGVGTGMLLVKKHYSGVKLQWNQTIPNGKLTVEEAKNFDFGVTLMYDGNPAEKQTNVHYLYSGFTSKWRPYSSTTTPPTEPGRYVVTVVTLGGNYQAAPITRSFQITK